MIQILLMYVKGKFEEVRHEKRYKDMTHQVAG